ncbi:hypothetical protein QVD17_03248 [Tagetes erecta]|uniref:Uncharacterized protein n=1 Tax=Tagetes erecta TaxID=13708 RepID=A0AAD8LFD6_TARER|nr:hypothetical protein QVD17_14703 [Tagetes erecta]KAK1437457.1 hypothetical protein QVD17_03248 [Tagetes erecta]
MPAKEERLRSDFGREGRTLSRKLDIEDEVGGGVTPNLRAIRLFFSLVEVLDVKAWHKTQKEESYSASTENSEDDDLFDDDFPDTPNAFAG